MPEPQPDSLEQIHFPALSITARGVVSALRGRDSLQLGYARMLRKNWYRGLRVIDGEGRSFRVTRAESLGGSGPLWGFSLLYSRRIRLGLTLEAERVLGLSEVQDLVCAAMARDRDFWEATVAEDGAAGWQAKVRGAPSIPALIELLPAQ
jgi:hypothetical protein